MATAREPARRLLTEADFRPGDATPYAGLAAVGERIRRQEISPVDLVRACLARIDRLNPRLNAFITVLASEALEQAGAAADEIAAGRWRGPLHGIPVGVKDLFDTAGIRTTAAFEHFRKRIPSKDAIAVARLEQAGAIIIGKTNMHRLAMGTTSAASDFGPVCNPWNADHIAGGSSGGSAAAVAAGLGFAALDTDAIGSCRLPAACCGVTGFKGTYGLIAGRGILEGEPVDDALLWLAHVAITARRVEDIAVILDVLAEPGIPLKAVRRGRPRIGIVKNFVADDDVMRTFRAAVEVLGGLGTLREVTAPFDIPGFDVRSIAADRGAIAGSLFREIDLLALPTTTAAAPRLADVTGDPMALSPANTMFANYYGLPAVSVPCGFTPDGLPLGLQIVGAPHDDLTVLELARCYQDATAWSERHPAALEP